MNISMWQQAFVDYMQLRQWSPRTVEGYSREAERFLSFMVAEEVRDVRGISRELLEAYRSHLFTTESNGRRLTPRTQAARLGGVKAFVRFLFRQDYLPVDWARELDLPRLPQPLPRTLLTPEQVVSLMEVPDLTTPLGLRDRALLELLYSSAIRNSELRALKLDDVNFERYELYVRQGKGKKARVVPLGREAARALRAWMQHGRSRLMIDGKAALLFCTWRGRPMSREDVAHAVGQISERAGMAVRVTPHLLRHCCATHMLANGAGVRHLQELLGHASLASTQRYTKIEISDLREVHRRCHPRERGLN